MRFNLTYILIGLLLVAMGIALVVKTPWFIQSFGRNSWAEAKLGGGTNTLLNLIGLALIFIGFSMIFDLWENLLGFVLSPLINR